MTWTQPTLPMEDGTGIEAMVEQAHQIVRDAAAEHGPIQKIFLMLSGGNDSMVLLDVCQSLADEIVHINTGVGIPATNEFVRKVVADLGRPLIEMHPPVPYRDIVLGINGGARPATKDHPAGGSLFGGFPGPGSHHFIYARLKQRCVEQVIRDHRTKRGQKFMLLTGIRNAESKRRMGYAHPVDVKGGQVWVNPLINWSNDLMREYRTTRNLPVNEVTQHLHMSGECLCGAFARPGELDEIAFFYPDFAAWIRSIEDEARAMGLPACKWGVRPPKKDENVVAGPMCSSCVLDDEEEECPPTSSSAPASEACPSASSVPGGSPAASSRSTPSANGCSPTTGPTSPSGETSPPWIQQSFPGLTSSPPDSPASPSPQRASRKRKRTSGGSGPTSPGLFAIFDPDTSSWRMCPLSSRWPAAERRRRSSGTWPYWGMTRNGRAYQLPTSALPISGAGSSSSAHWPTPLAQETGRSVEGFLEMRKNMEGGERTSITSLPVAVKAEALWPTPRVSADRTSRTAATGNSTTPRQKEELWPTPSATSYGTNRGGSDSSTEEGWSRAGKERPSLETMARHGLWPTPTARLGEQRGPQAKRYHDPARSNDLDDAVEAEKMWPTPAARDWKSPSSNKLEDNARPLNEVVTSGGAGPLNPAWVSQMMGFPDGWLDIPPAGPPDGASSSTNGKRRARPAASKSEPRSSEPSATRSFLPSQNSSADGSSTVAVRADASMLEEILRFSEADLSQPIYVDTETTGLDPWRGDKIRGISLTLGDRSWYLPLSHPHSANFDRLQIQHLLTKLTNRPHPWVWHNAKYDQSMFLSDLKTTLPADWCTDIGGWLEDENLPHGLKERASILGIDGATDERDEMRRLCAGPTLKTMEDALYAASRLFGAHKVTRAQANALARQHPAYGARQMWDLTAEEMAPYARRDTELTRDLHRYQRSLPPLVKAMPRELEVSRVLMGMERTGVRVDAAAAEHAYAAATARLATLEKGFDGINPGSHVQLVKLVIEDWGFPVLRRSPKTNEPCLDRETLELYGDDPRITSLLEYRRLSKGISAYYRPLLEALDENDRIHPSFKQTGTRTGRFSCERPNLQTIPREDTLAEVRKVFIPASGYELVSFDLKQAEVRYAAFLSQDPALLAALAAGEDPYDAVAQGMGIARQTAKAVVLANNYGASARRLAATMAKGTGRAVTPADVANAEKLQRRLADRFPGLARAVARAEDMARQEGRVALMPGNIRYRHFRGHGHPPEEYRKAFNSLCQGGVGELMKSMMVEMDRAGIWRDLGARTLLQVHDSLDVEVVPGTRSLLLERMQAVLDDVSWCRGVRFPVEAKPWREA